MSTTNKIPLSLDLSGSDVANKRTDEVVTVLGTTTKYLVLEYGAFFSESLVIKDQNTTLLENEDYIPVVYIEEVSDRSLKEVALAVIMLTPVSNTLTVTYQAVGGKYELYRDTLLTHLETLDFSAHTIERNALLGTETLFDGLTFDETDTTFLNLVHTLKDLEKLYLGLDDQSIETLSRANLEIQAIYESLSTLEGSISNLDNNLGNYITPTKELYNVDQIDNYPTWDNTRYLDPELPTNQRLTLGGLWNIFRKRYLEGDRTLRSPMVGKYSADLSALSSLPKHIPRLTKIDQDLPHDPNPTETLNYDGELYFSKALVNGVELPSSMNNLTIDGGLVKDTIYRFKATPETMNFIKNPYVGVSIDGGNVNNADNEQYTNPINLLNTHFNQLTHDVNIKNYNHNNNVVEIHSMDEINEVTLTHQRFNSSGILSDIDIKANYVYGNISKTITDPVLYANKASPYPGLVTNLEDFTYKHLDKSVTLNYLGVNSQQVLFDLYNLLIKVPIVEKTRETYIIDYPNDVFVGAADLLYAKRVKIRKDALDNSSFKSSEVDLVDPSFKTKLDVEPTNYLISDDDYYLIDFDTVVSLYV